MESRCENCRFYSGSGRDSEGDVIGECRRFPPNGSGEAFVSGLFAITVADWWCGEYESCTSGNFVEMKPAEADQVQTAIFGSPKLNQTKLSPRQQQVCNMLLGGYSVKQIAESLGIKAQRVNVIRKDAKRKSDFICRNGGQVYYQPITPPPPSPAQPTSNSA